MFSRGRSSGCRWFSGKAFGDVPFPLRVRRLAVRHRSAVEQAVGAMHERGGGDHVRNHMVRQQQSGGHRGLTFVPGDLFPLLAVAAW